MIYGKRAAQIIDGRSLQLSLLNTSITIKLLKLILVNIQNTLKCPKQR